MAVPPTKSENKPKQQTELPAASTTPEAETTEDPSSKEAALPGQWEEVEEESYDNPYFKAEIASEFADAAEARKPNPKKRERYEDDDNALYQMEAESKNSSSTRTAERVPERYRTDLASVEPTEEPMFKKKVAKGANIKKRAKQLWEKTRHSKNKFRPVLSFHSVTRSEAKMMPGVYKTLSLNARLENTVQVE